MFDLFKSKQTESVSQKNKQREKKYSYCFDDGSKLTLTKLPQDSSYLLASFWTLTKNGKRIARGNGISFQDVFKDGLSASEKIRGHKLVQIDIRLPQERYELVLSKMSAQRLKSYIEANQKDTVKVTSLIPEEEVYINLEKITSIKFEDIG